MNCGDGNRNRKEQQIGDQPRTPLVRCLVLEAKILNLRGKKLTAAAQGQSTGGNVACSTARQAAQMALEAAARGGCMQRQRTGGGRRRGGSALLLGRLGAGGRPAQYRAHARGSCAQGAEAAPRRRKRRGPMPAATADAKENGRRR